MPERARIGLIYALNLGVSSAETKRVDSNHDLTRARASG